MVVLLMGVAGSGKTTIGRQFAAGDATAGAPEAGDGFFLVPPIVENVNP